MSDIRFDCPACEKHLVVDAEGAGVQVACPKCGTRITIPTPDAPEPAAEPDPVATLKGDENPTLPPSTSGLSNGLHIKKKEADEGDSHGEDVNVDQPFGKKHDQWFTTNHGKKYHYCYYNPHGRLMKTACGSTEMEITAEFAGNDLGRIRKGAFCRGCLKALDLDVNDLG